MHTLIRTAAASAALLIAATAFAETIDFDADTLPDDGAFTAGDLTETFTVGDVTFTADATGSSQFNTFGVSDRGLGIDPDNPLTNPGQVFPEISALRGQRLLFSASGTAGQPAAFTGFVIDGIGNFQAGGVVEGLMADGSATTILTFDNGDNVPGNNLPGDFFPVFLDPADGFTALRITPTRGEFTLGAATAVVIPTPGAALGGLGVLAAVACVRRRA